MEKKNPFENECDLPPFDAELRDLDGAALGFVQVDRLAKRTDEQGIETSYLEISSHPRERRADMKALAARKAEVRLSTRWHPIESWPCRVTAADRIEGLAPLDGVN